MWEKPRVLYLDFFLTPKIQREH